MAFSQAKRDGAECFVWDCREPDPGHAVTWKCGNGHRTVFWYCAGHIAEMTSLAVRSCMCCRECGAYSFAMLDGVP